MDESNCKIIFSGFVIKTLIEWQHWVRTFGLKKLFTTVNNILCHCTMTVQVWWTFYFRLFFSVIFTLQLHLLPTERILHLPCFLNQELFKAVVILISWNLANTGYQRVNLNKVKMQTWNPSGGLPNSCKSFNLFRR